MAPQRRSARISAQSTLTERPAPEAKEPKSRVPKSGVASKTNTQNSKTPAGKSIGVTGAKPSKKRKEKTLDEVADSTGPRSSKIPEFKVPDLPSTPKRQRTSRTQPSEAPVLPFPPLTPRRKSDAPDFNRPVDPHRSSATLLTPRGSHVTAYPSNVELASPSKTGLPRPTATTGNILEHGIAHLVSVDPRFQQTIDKYPSPPWGPADLAEEVDPFRSLTSGIIGQQVSGAAANSIKRRFIALFNEDDEKKDENTTKAQNNTPAASSSQDKKDADEYDYNDSVNPRFPTPEEVAKFDIATLRTAGLSQRKAEYIKGLAEKFASGELSARMLLTATDVEVLAKLIAVRGLGQWSVEMFSCFGLKRLDVFATGDLGVQYAAFLSSPCDMVPTLTTAIV